VHSLARHSESLSHLRPGPAGAHRPLDLGVLQAIGHGSKGQGGRKAVGRAVKRGWFGRRHLSNDSCLSPTCQLRLLITCGPLKRNRVVPVSSPFRTENADCTRSALMATYNARVENTGRPSRGALLHLIAPGAPASVCGKVPADRLTNAGRFDEQVCPDCIHVLTSGWQPDTCA
jgi:hypothetical protein